MPVEDRFSLSWELFFFCSRLARGGAPEISLTILAGKLLLSLFWSFLVTHAVEMSWVWLLCDMWKTISKALQRGWEQVRNHEGLNKNIPHKLMYLNPWSPVGGSAWRSLGSVAFLEGRFH